MDGEFVIKDMSKEPATAEDIKEIFTEAAVTIGGYESVECNIFGFPEFKMTWARGAQWIKMSVSDYMVGIPRGIVETIANTLMLKLKGCGGDYDPDALEYLSSVEFSKMYQQKFLDRHGVAKVGLSTELKNIIKKSTKMGSSVPENVFAGYNHGNNVAVSRSMRVVTLPQCAKKLRPESRAFIIEHALKDMALGMEDCHKDSVTWNYTDSIVCDEDVEIVARICGGNAHWFFME